MQSSVESGIESIRLTAGEQITLCSSIFSAMQNWRESLANFRDRREYVESVNEQYDYCANKVGSRTLVNLRLARSLWAKKIAEYLTMTLPPQTAAELGDVGQILSIVRTLITDSQVQRLIHLQSAIGNEGSRRSLALLLCEHSRYETATGYGGTLRFSDAMLWRLGPARVKKFRPIRKRGNFDPNAWLTDATMSQVEFVDGDPDRIRVRGIELHSGDIGIVELNEPGDGVLESFLEEPGIAPHAMLFVTRRIRDASTHGVLYQPCAVEIFEGGWRCVPITTALHPSFSWYSEWVRPTRCGQSLALNIGSRLSAELDEMENFAFDFQSRAVPAGGCYTGVADGSTATCSNFVRIPFERAGVSGLPYPTTFASAGAQANFSLLGLSYPGGIYTPTNILNDSEFSKVGIVDNGQTEMSFAGALVLGRPRWVNSFGGWVSQKTLCLDNLPNWKSIRHWRSAFEALKVKLGQSDGLLGRTARGLFHVNEAEVPKSASDTAIAFYLRTAFEAGHIISKLVAPALGKLFSSNAKIWSIEDLHEEPIIDQLCADGINASSLVREHWYCDN